MKSELVLYWIAIRLIVSNVKQAAYSVNSINTVLQAGDGKYNITIAMWKRKESVRNTKKNCKEKDKGSKETNQF